MRFIALLIGLLLLSIIFTAAGAQSGYFTVSQSSELTYDEAQVVYLTNLARQNNGLPPLRWNRELTDSARWYAWDRSTNTLPAGCTSAHQDSYCNYPLDRAEIFGYPGFAGAENTWLTYVAPQPAVDGWLNSSGHRNNILSSEHREVGLGYSNTNGGWIGQDFGRDPAYPPVVINNEAPSTNSRQVNLYVYDREDAGGFTALRPAVDMQVSEDECFVGASWVPFNNRPNFTLSNPTGWKQVFVRTRDAYGHTYTVEDSIYYGDSLPRNQMGAAHLAATNPDVTVYNLNNGGRSHVQFSLGWVSDQFKDLSNNNLFQQINDSAALNGKAVTLPGPNGQNSTWAWTTTFQQNVPMVAYFRLKVNNNTSSSTVATLRVRPGNNPEITRPLTGTSFPAANQYREVAIPFTFVPNSANPFMIFRVDRNGAANITLDSVTIFTAPQSFTGATMTWAQPNGSYRGQGVWVRYSQADGSNFTPIASATTARPELKVPTESLIFMHEQSTGQSFPQTHNLIAEPRCGPTFNWSVNDNANWLNTAVQGSYVQVNINPGGLALGEYNATLTFNADSSHVPPVQVAVRLLVVPDIKQVFLPSIQRP
jgi:uncharacterized protein YkwD